jgi:hypothetical protein
MKVVKQPIHVDAKSFRSRQIIIYFKFQKMKTTKMSLVNIQGKLSRAEMKNIMAGSGGDNCPTNCTSACSSGSNCRCCGTGSNAYCVDAGNTCP